MQISVPQVPPSLPRGSYFLVPLLASFWLRCVWLGEFANKLVKGLNNCKLNACRTGGSGRVGELWGRSQSQSLQFQFFRNLFWQEKKKRKEINSVSAPRLVFSFYIIFSYCRLIYFFCLLQNCWLCLFFLGHVCVYFLNTHCHISCLYQTCYTIYYILLLYIRKWKEYLELIIQISITRFVFSDFGQYTFNDTIPRDKSQRVFYYSSVYVIEYTHLLTHSLTHSLAKTTMLNMNLFAQVTFVKWPEKREISTRPIINHILRIRIMIEKRNKLYKHALFF